MADGEIKTRAALCGCLACLTAFHVADHLTARPHHCPKACVKELTNGGHGPDPFYLDDLGLEHGS